MLASVKIFSVLARSIALSLLAAAGPPADGIQVANDKGDSVKPTGLKPVYPEGYHCPPITSLYGSWTDIDGTRRSEIHTGVDAGNLGDWIVSPASGTVRAVWRADWSWGSEGALLIRHDRKDVNLEGGPRYYYSEFDHLAYDDIEHLKHGQRIERGQRLARVTRPGGNSAYLPEVHWEVWEVDKDEITWRTNTYGAQDWWNETAALIDPLYMLALHNSLGETQAVRIAPFVRGTEYGRFRGFTYILECVPK
ncbi:MAG: M23 family metallopeptidase [Hyphomicrobium sp.]